LILRQWGLEAAVADVSLPRAESLFAFEGETLLAADFQRRELPVDDVNPASPTPGLICSQEQLEPVLRARAKDRGVDMRFSTEVVGFTEDGDVERRGRRGRRTGLGARPVPRRRGRRSGPHA